MFDRRRQRDDGVGRCVAERRHLDDLRRPERESARLVERHTPDACGAFEMDAALDQHALARGAGERGDNRDRRRDDERARARHDQQHQRAVDPRVPEATEHKRRRDGDGDRKQQHRGRVDTREAFDERLRRRALRLRLLDEMDDARQRRVAADVGDAHIERATAVDGAREHGVSRELLHRQRLAGNRRLIDRALAGDDDAVERNLLAGADDEDHAHGDALDIDSAIAGRVADERVGRREIEQRAHGVARAFERPCLERLREREEKDHRRGFRPLPQRDGANGRHQHQDVDVEQPHTERDEGLPHGQQCASDDRDAQDTALYRQAAASGMERQAGGEREA